MCATEPSLNADYASGERQGAAAPTRIVEQRPAVALKEALRRTPPDPGWADELRELQSLLLTEESRFGPR